MTQEQKKEVMGQDPPSGAKYQIYQAQEHAKNNQAAKDRPLENKVSNDKSKGPPYPLIGNKEALHIKPDPLINPI
jgi:hypothetical protein